MGTTGTFTFDSVLVVDDSEIDVLVNRRLMELTGFARNIVITNNGEEALRYLQTECASAAHAPDWIFLDMHLPGMNGIDFIESFKTLPGFIRKKSRIVILSVIQKPEVISDLLENPFVHGQLNKPLTQNALLDLAETKRPVTSSF